MNSDGTYTFLTDTPGEYTYNVPVILPGAPLPAPTQLLTIEVESPL